MATSRCSAARFACLRVRAGAERPSPTNHQPAFVVVEDAVGLAVLNRGLPGHEALVMEQGVTLALTLLRCVGWLSCDDLRNRLARAGPGLGTPEAQCLEVHRLARAYTVPAEAVVSPGMPAAGAEHERAWLTIAGNVVELGALKRWERGEALVLRLVNVRPRPSTAQIRFARPPSAARLATLSEQPGDRLPRQGDGAWQLEVAPYRALTLVATPGPQ